MFFKGLLQTAECQLSPLCTMREDGLVVAQCLMRLAVGTDPAQTRGRAASAHKQWEGHPKYMSASHMTTAPQLHLSLY